MSEAYLDAALSPEERAEALLEELSLEEKIAQVRGVWGIRAEMWQAQGEAFRQFVRDGIGQVSTLAERECRSLEEAVQVQKLCHGGESAPYSGGVSYGGSLRRVHHRCDKLSGGDRARRVI